MDTTVPQRTARTEGMRGNMATAAMGLGGVLALVGSFMTWASVRLAGPLAAQGPLAGPRRQGRGGSFGVALNNKGQVALTVRFDNGPKTVVLLTPTPQ